MTAAAASAAVPLPGSQFPLGTTVRDGGTNFAVASGAADAMMLCLTLRDLVSYNDKHNEATGESNHDGPSAPGPSWCSPTRTGPERAFTGKSSYLQVTYSQRPANGQARR
jgi:pullulanase/glycogen debranching enzyme